MVAGCHNQQRHAAYMLNFTQSPALDSAKQFPLPQRNAVVHPNYGTISISASKHAETEMEL